MEVLRLRIGAWLPVWYDNIVNRYRIIIISILVLLVFEYLIAAVVSVSRPAGAQSLGGQRLALHTKD